MISSVAKNNKLEAKILLDVILVFLLGLALFLNFLKIFAVPETIFVILSFIGLAPVLKSAISAFFKKQLTIDLLASAALIFSFLAQEWYSAVFINLMLGCARIFDSWTAMRTKRIIQHLLKYRPLTAKIKKGENIVEIPADEVRVGDLVVIGVGARIPVDGIVVSGQASINESTITGESELVTKKNGDEVFSSTLNEIGSLLVRAEKIGEDSTLDKIISLVEEASRKKSPTEQVAIKFVRWYIIATFIGAAVLYFFLKNTDLVLAVLLVACADDIAVAVPLTFTVAIAQAARRGIIIKGSAVIEKIPKINFFMSDKTGTLTYGKPAVEKISPFSNTEESFLKILGTAEINSRHPSSIAIINYLKGKNINFPAPDEFNEIPGDGVIAIKNNKKILAGKINFLENNGVIISQDNKKIMEEAKQEGLGVMAVAIDKELMGFIALKDEIRKEASLVVEETKQYGVESWIMLTGDNEIVASKTAEQLGIDKYKANLKPEDKLKYIEIFKKEHPEKILAMIGDGVNDAAALAMADVSIAMGIIGSDAAIEAADIALATDNLSRIEEVMALAKKSMQIVKQNFWIWGIINVFGLALVFLGILKPISASAYNFLTDFLPIFNALRAMFHHRNN